MEENWFEGIDVHEWFNMHPEILKNSIPDKHYLLLRYSLEDTLQSLGMTDAVIEVVGEQKFSTGWEPVYRISLHHDVRVCVSFPGCEPVIVVVDSLKPLAINWLGLFDPDHHPCHARFYQTSYSENHQRFSLGLQSGYVLSAFFLLLLSAK